MAEIQYKNLRKVFRDGTVAVEDLSLSVSDGEFIVLVGPSGCGKTTTLMMTAGLETVTQGEIVIGGSTVNDIPPKDRDIAMVFQSYALYPHMNVKNNIAFGLRRRRMPNDEIEERVMAAARRLDLEPYLKRKPAELSGGQRQRVAMGRAIVRRPRLFLLDEPLSNLDAKLRVQMRAEIKQLQRHLGATTVYVTHDQTEAMTMGDRVVVMRKGVLEQVGTPHELYHAPSNLFVAEFIGSPSMNLIKADVEAKGERVLIHLGLAGQVLEMVDDPTRDRLRGFHGTSVAVGFRPENITLVAEHTDNSVRAEIRHVEDLGAEQMIYFAISAPPVVTEQTREVAKDVDEVVASDLVRHDTGQTLCVGRLPADTSVSVGGWVDVLINPRKLHFFDLTTGTSVPNNSAADIPVSGPAVSTGASSTHLARRA
jgi:multiple sugar transport system ATP-binding protein